MILRSLRIMALAGAAAIAAFQCDRAHADDAACGSVPTWTTPCQFFPPGPSIADHSGNHDHEFFWILFNAYADEWNRMPPEDPNAPPTRRSTAYIAPVPQTSPPMPFTDWPVGGTEVIGASTPNSVDSPLMKALIGGTPIGKPLEDAHIQIYGWIDVGGNVSTASHGYGGNAPVADSFTPNTLQLDQAVVYIERVPDTVQTTNIDWGFRLSPMYGENYRYTTALGFFSNQFVYQNHFAGFDMPMVYGEVYVPYVAEGLLFRFGRYITLPDIEAQLAPNDYTYTRSITYSVDNYSTTGLNTTLKVTKNWLLQVGIGSGSETVPWNVKVTSIPGYIGPRDPGAQPSLSGCIQYQTDTNYDNVYLCIDGIDNGQWGYNNLNWYGGTYFHKFNEQFHVAVEAYYEFQRDVWNKNYTGPGFANNPINPYFGTPWFGMVNPPRQAICNPDVPTCTANEYGLLAFWNYRIGTFDNLTLRTEFYNDMKGQRTGFATRYFDISPSWQHWFGPQVEVRPEIGYYRALDAAAFDNGNARQLWFLGCDMIWHF
jgi:Putative beta-barrel porin-2, OmpL-like. bbp2